MHVLCPSCSTENNIDIGREISCGKCHASLSGFVYKKYKKPLISAISALIIGAYGSYKMEDMYFDYARYPLAVEYAIIDACATSDRSILTLSEFANKKYICLCAFEKSMSEIPYAEYKKSTNEFFSTFKSKVYECK